MAQLSFLAPDVAVLTTPVPAGPETSWIRAGATGFEPHNQYVLLSQDRALLLDTGVAATGPSLLPTLREVVGSRRLHVLLTRIELEAIGNLPRILSAFPDVVVGTPHPIPPLELLPMTAAQRRAFATADVRIDEPLSAMGFDRLVVRRPVIRTLSTSWIYDRETGIFFSSDFFCADLLSEARQEVVRREAGGMPGEDEVMDTILAKFDWLGLARMDRLRPLWDDFMSRHEIQAIAPARGRPVAGRGLTAQVLATYRRVLFEPSIAERLRHRQAPRTA